MMSSHTDPHVIAALRQRFGRSPYADGANVAMRKQGNPGSQLLHRGSRHKSLGYLRYLAIWRSKQIGVLGLHNNKTLVLSTSSGFFCLGDVSSAQPLQAATLVPRTAQDRGQT